MSHAVAVRPEPLPTFVAPMARVAGVAGVSGSARTAAIVVDQRPGTRLDAKTTLEKMRQRVHEQLALPIVWETARGIVVRVTPRDEIGQARAIREWCAVRFRFINDPLWTQLLTTPVYNLTKIRDQGFVQGNCADAAMLTAALCGAIRIPSTFVTVAFPDPRYPLGLEPYAHVFAIAYPRQQSCCARAAVEMDITRPPQVRHARFTRRLRVEV